MGCDGRGASDGYGNIPSIGQIHTMGKVLWMQSKVWASSPQALRSESAKGSTPWAAGEHRGQAPAQEMLAPAMLAPHMKGQSGTPWSHLPHLWGMLCRGHRIGPPGLLWFCPAS